MRELRPVVVLCVVVVRLGRRRRALRVPGRRVPSGGMDSDGHDSGRNVEEGLEAEYM